MTDLSLTPDRRAAIALLTLSREEALSDLRLLGDREIERLVSAIVSLENISSESIRDVRSQFVRLLRETGGKVSGGPDVALDLVGDAIGRPSAEALLERLESNSHSRGFRRLRNIDARHLAAFIRSEHPQMIALILAQLSHEQAAAVLIELPSDLQADVTRRLAEMENISPDVLDQIEAVLEQHLETSQSDEGCAAGGAKQAAGILNLLDSSTEQRVLQRIGSWDEQLAAQIKNLMFIFDDIRLLDDRCVQRLLKEIEIKDLARALKSASDGVREKIFGNLSERAVGVIREEIEFMGPVRLSDVEAAQQRIVDMVRRLEDEGLIVIAGRGIRQDVIL